MRGVLLFKIYFLITALCIELYILMCMCIKATFLFLVATTLAQHYNQYGEVCVILSRVLVHDDVN